MALGAVFAMSSTAVLTKLLAERMELDATHGREVIGVLLFQDLAVVPLLVLLPAPTMLTPVIKTSAAVHISTDMTPAKK